MLLGVRGRSYDVVEGGAEVKSWNCLLDIADDGGVHTRSPAEAMGDPAKMGSLSKRRPPQRAGRD